MRKVKHVLCAHRPDMASHEQSRPLFIDCVETDCLEGRTLPLAVTLLCLPVLVGGALRARRAATRALARWKLRGRLVLACTCAPCCQGGPCRKAWGLGFVPVPPAHALACGQLRGASSSSALARPAVRDGAAMPNGLGIGVRAHAAPRKRLPAGSFSASAPHLRSRTSSASWGHPGIRIRFSGL